MLKTYQSGTFAAATPSEDGVIRNVVMCQVGEAKGHGVLLDKSFIANVVKFGQEAGKAGIKARFGHPTMSDNATGDGLGRYHNIRLSEDGTQAIGDLHLADYAAKSPRGNLKEYITDRAAEDPDSFGSSIVFQPGGTYQKDSEGNRIERGSEEWQAGEDQYQEIEQLLGCDIVDEPAATDGLFNAQNSRSFAVRITDFLDNNPKLYEFLDSHPDMLGKVTEFMGKYKSYKMSKEEKKPFLQRIGLRKGEQPETVENDLQFQVDELRAHLGDQEAELTAYKQGVEALAGIVEGIEKRFDVLELAEDVESGVNELKEQFAALKEDAEKLSDEVTKQLSEVKSTYEGQADNDLAGGSRVAALAKAGYNVPEGLAQKMNENDKK